MVKVDNQQTVNSNNIVNQSAADYRALLVLELLVKSTKEILEDIMATELEVNAQVASSSKEEQVSSSNAPSLANSPQPSNNGSSKPSSDMSNSILESYIEQLEMNQSLGLTSQDTVKLMIKYTSEELNALKNLAAEIQELESELKNGVTQQEAAAIEAKLASLESDYNQALAQYNADHTDYENNQKTANEAAAQYKQLEAEYNALSDKSSPQAKQLKKEMEAAQSTEKTAQKAMAHDQSGMNQAAGTIANVVSSLQSYANKYPLLGQAIENLIAVMKGSGNITDAAAALAEAVSALVINPSQIQLEIQEMEQTEQAMIDSLSDGAANIKAALELFVEGSQKITEQMLAQLIKDHFDQQIGRKVEENSKKQDKENISKIAQKPRHLRNENEPVHRKEHKLNTHAV